MPQLKYMVETFLPLASVNASDLAPDADAAWLMSKGIDPAAPALVRQLRDEVLPLIRRLEKNQGLEWYSFLVHAYPLVPTLAADTRAFIHLRLSFKSKKQAHGCLGKYYSIEPLPVEWRFTQAIKMPTEIAGVDPKVLWNGGIHDAWRIIGEQSAWLLSFIDRHKKTEDVLQLVKHMRQFLHFFANAVQVRVA